MKDYRLKFKSRNGISFLERVKMNKEMLDYMLNR